MLDLQVECERCGATLKIIREWPDSWKYRATVEPCEDCLAEVRPTPRAADVCPECGGDGADHEDSSKDCFECGGSGKRR